MINLEENRQNCQFRPCLRLITSSAFCVILHSSLQAVPLVSHIACTAAQVALYYVRLPNWNVACSTQVSSLLQSCTERLDWIYSRQLLRHEHYEFRSGQRAQRYLARDALSRCGRVFKVPSFETALLEAVVMTSEETSPSFMEPVIAAHTVTEVYRDTISTIVESDSDATSWKLQALPKSVVKLLCDMKREIECSLPNSTVVTKTNVEAVVENYLIKWIITIQSQIVRTVDSILKVALRENYFN